MKADPHEIFEGVEGLGLRMWREGCICGGFRVQALNPKACDVLILTVLSRDLSGGVRYSPERTVRIRGNIPT